MPGESVISNPVLGTLRLRQALDLARAYDIAHNPNSTLKSILKLLSAAEDTGVFNRPPKNLYYFEKAKYTSDEIQVAKLNGGFFTRKVTGRVDTAVPCTVLFPWRGPDPEADRKPPESEFGNVTAKQRASNKVNAQKGIIAQLRKECKELGLNSFGKGREVLARMIAEKKGLIQKIELVPGVERPVE